MVQVDSALPSAGVLLACIELFKCWSALDNQLNTSRPQFCAESDGRGIGN